VSLHDHPTEEPYGFALPFLRALTAGCFQNHGTFLRVGQYLNPSQIVGPARSSSLEPTEHEVARAMVEAMQTVYRKTGKPPSAVAMLQQLRAQYESGLVTWEIVERVPALLDAGEDTTADPEVTIQQAADVIRASLRRRAIREGVADYGRKRDLSKIVQLETLAERVGKPLAEQGGNPFLRISADALFADLGPIPWLVQALDIAPGAPTLIAGYGFAGKTIFAQALALAIAAGLELALDLFPIRGGHVLHLDYEQGRRLTLDRYQRLARGLGITPAQLAGKLDVVCLPTRYLGGDGAEDFLCREVENHAACIIDPFRAACPGADENSSKDVRPVLDMFTRVSERTGCVMIDLHHARKPQKDAKGGARMAIRGSGDFYAGHGSVLVFDAEKGGPTNVSHDKARISGKTHEDFVLLIQDSVGDDGEPALLVTASQKLTPDEDEVAAGRLADAMERVAKVLLNHPEPSVRELRKLTRMNHELLGAALDGLEREGRLVREPAQRRGGGTTLRLVRDETERET
jgi:hypothetical protein